MYKEDRMEPYIQNIIAPKLGGSMLVMPAAVLVLTLGLVAIFAGIMYDMKKSSVCVDGGFLTVKAFVYGKKIPLGEIRSDGVRRLNLLEDRDYGPTIRVNGVGLPGYRAGWVRLKNGRKAFVHITDKTKVALIPTEKYDVLLSVEDFEGLKNALSQ
jgi:hypothetical protein